jgi:hypothetical protein
MLVTRYYYPGTLIFWAVLVIISSKVKWKEFPLLQIALIAFMLIVCTQTYARIYSAEKSNALNCSQTVSTVSSLLGTGNRR